MTLSRPNARGFAILYAILMVSIVLTISLTLLDITFKQLVLSSINQESKKAYYTAVSTLNCVSYWDNSLQHDGEPYYPFGHFSGPNFIPPSAGQPNILCAGQPPSIEVNERSFSLVFSFPQIGGGPNTEAQVTVTKGNDTNGVANGGTLIRVDGFNTSDPNNPRRVQRSLEAN